MPEHILNAKNCSFYNGMCLLNFEKLLRNIFSSPVQFKYTCQGYPEITSNDMIDLLIKRELTRTVGTLNDAVLEEVDASMANLFGADGEPRNVSVYMAMGRTVGRAVNRIFVGKELC